MATDEDRTDPQDLGLDLSGDDDGQRFKWLVACLLFATRITQEIGADAFRALDDDGLLTPAKLSSANWQHVVELFDDAGYTRFDESKASQLIQLGKDVQERYDGKLSRLREGADTTKALTDRLTDFSGIGPKAAEIFLREVDWT